LIKISSRRTGRANEINARLPGPRSIQAFNQSRRPSTAGASTADPAFRVHRSRKVLSRLGLRAEAEAKGGGGAAGRGGSGDWAGALSEASGGARRSAK